MSQATQEESESIWIRISNNPRPAAIWVAGLLVLLAFEFGAVLQTIAAIFEVFLNIIKTSTGIDLGVGAIQGLKESFGNIPTLLSRETIPNNGYWTGEQWKGTFMGWQPMYAWLLRVILIYVYAFAFLGWVWFGYRTYKKNYRYADWTPRDDMARRLRTHRWGQFGFIIVFAFIVFAAFAPAMGPTTVEKNIISPGAYQFQYCDQNPDGSCNIDKISVFTANYDSTSQGDAETNVGPMSYDDYGRFHPFGTLTTGKDLFTFMAGGARLSLFIGLGSMVLAGFLAVSFALASAYYKGLVDLGLVIASDTLMSLPGLLLYIILSVVFASTWLGQVYSGALLMVLIFGIASWPGLWRAVRGPAFQVSEQEWIDAARSYGQKPRVTMRKHILPYIVGYLLIYGSMYIGGIIIAVSGLTFLGQGLGISPPTPEWGRAIAEGRQYVATSSWHISLIPGFMIVLVVTAFNALGDGIRDAIDPQAGGDESDAAVGASGGGA